MLAGRVAVVTGSSRGLGFAMARVLGRHGASVVLASRSDAEVAAAVERLHTEGVEASGRRCDMAVWTDVEALREEARALGTLDIWVNNAGTSGVYGPTASTPVEDFARVVRTNILGTFHGSRVALPVFLGQGHGDLVNVYGQGDQGPVALQNAYASSKRWVRQFTETLRTETKGSGVRVHGMNPGLVTTELLGSVTSQPGYEQRLGGLQVGRRPVGSDPGSRRATTAAPRHVRRRRVPRPHQDDLGGTGNPQPDVRTPPPPQPNADDHQRLGRAPLSGSRVSTLTNRDYPPVGGMCALAVALGVRHTGDRLGRCRPSAKCIWR